MMKATITDLIDFSRVDPLLEGFNKTTGFVTGILDLNGKILSRSGWRHMCTDYHRIHPETAKRCTISDTVLASKLTEGESYHFYQCLNGLVDVAVPIIINGEHVANLFSGQFFFDEPDVEFFRKQAREFGFDEEKYLDALKKVPVVSKEQVTTAMDFLLNMTRLISELAFQRLEQTELNEQLVESEKKYRLLFDANPHPMWVYDLETLDFLEVNEATINKYGYSRKEFLTMNLKDIRPEEDIPDLLHNVSQPSRKLSFSGEWRHKSKAGEVFTVEIISHEIEYRSRPARLVLANDITERKIAEEKLKESYSLLRITGEKAKLGGWNVNLKENRSYWSDGVAAIHEMPPGYCPLVEDGIRFYAPEWRERITEVYSECVRNGTPYDEEMEIITSTGKRVWVRTMGEAVRDEQGNIYKIQGAFQDISQRKAAEEKIREKDLQFRKLSANVPDLIFQFTRRPDGSYCVPVASAGIRNIFGCSPEEVTDNFEPIARVLYPEDAERVIRDIEYSANHMTYFTCEFRVQIPGRPVQWIFSRSSPEKLPDGSITWYGFNTDITFRKEADEAIQRLNAELEQRVIERTSQLAAANKELEAFSYSVSHDLRAPLRHINGYIGLLNESYRDALPEEALHYFDIVSDAAKQMGNLIDDLLQFSRTGRAEVIHGQIDMNGMVNEIISKVTQEVRNREIRWVLASLPRVSGDYSLIKQVWVNLIDNAVKYTKYREPAEISIGYTEEEGFITYFVKDNGVGFEMEYVDKLFGVFQRLHSQQEFDGTGIGLANVQRIIHKHNGNVWAEGEKGKGATFYFSLPLRAGEAR